MNLGQGQDWNDVVLSKRHTGAAASASKNVRAVCTCSLRETLALHLFVGHRTSYRVQELETRACCVYRRNKAAQLSTQRKNVRSPPSAVERDTTA